MVTRGQAIKQYCKNQCCAGDLKSWKGCTAKLCFLWRFKDGKNPTAKELAEIKDAEKGIATPSFFDRNTYEKEGSDE